MAGCHRGNLKKYNSALDTSACVPIQSICNVTKFSEADPLADKTPILQQPVISIRISDELRQRLDTLKEIMAAKSGEQVSTSEAAKQLLESSKEERLEFVNLLSEPTDSLVKIRGKVDAKLPLSQAEWTLIAYYCQQGAELLANTGQTDISFESLAGLLTNLPAERQTATKPSEDIADDDVRRAVNRTLHTLKNANSETPRPIHTARLLYMILDNEKFLNIEKLNEGLRPYWPILWRVCARGHYLRHEEPLRDGAFWGADSRLRNPGPLPSFQEGEYRLEFHRGPETEFSVWLYFPGRFALPPRGSTKRKRSASSFALGTTGSPSHFMMTIGRRLRVCFAGAGRPPK